ncbi:hypothetical protein HN018_06730 [Lichenicola cladoniae]|uniref:Uncharacterized protein n=1 Tax=Lichenicola cladoniae TaxID=1484109 RepID=A0A6M8HN57_9PROT|nr:hypothetical protein [Lichenicola cladoniae]NPD67267.1 hypothetical protein [Acetobacteraceae bacterium]QKE89772.1 hypothetical protein HN018_06730 [Lichenicola cladoniae]
MDVGERALIIAEAALATALVNKTVTIALMTELAATGAFPGLSLSELCESVRANIDHHMPRNPATTSLQQRIDAELENFVQSAERIDASTRQARNRQARKWWQLE